MAHDDSLPAMLAAALGRVMPGGEASAASEVALTAWGTVLAWLHASYAHAPALVMGSVAMLAVPPLAVLGLVLRRRGRERADTTLTLRPRRPSTSVSPGDRDSDGMTWPVDAWIEIEGKDGARFPLGREMLRIGREDDNDVTLPLRTVHRYHAVIHRNEHAEIMLVDTSSAGGNGVAVNGTRVTRERLKNGDVIEIGEARLKFSTRRH